jgi:hypothetical protein
VSERDGLSSILASANVERMRFTFDRSKMERLAREGVEKHLDSVARAVDAYRCPVHGEGVTIEDGVLAGCCDRAEKEAVALVEGRGERFDPK